MKRVLLITAGVVLAATPAVKAGSHWEMKTPDGVTIHANFEGGKTCTRAAVLLHMLGKSKNDWAGFQAALQKAGICSVALDMRGHGQSVKHEGKPDLHYENFMLKDWDAVASNDVRVALGVLRKRLDKKAPLPAIIGASIGANLAIVAGTRHELSGVAALSPGEDYKGVRPGSILGDMKLPLFLSASKDDAKSYAATQGFQKAYSGKKTYLYFTNAGHGTNMLKDPKLGLALIKWLKTLK